MTTSVGLFYLGAFNVLLARFAGTCTHGDAGRLLGIWLTALLFAGALWALAASPRRPLILMMISPVLLALVWQTVFSAHLVHALLWQGVSACEALEGISYPPDGRETLYGIAWPVITGATWIGLFTLWPRRKPILSPRIT